MQVALAIPAFGERYCTSYSIFLRTDLLFSPLKPLVSVRTLCLLALS